MQSNNNCDVILSIIIPVYNETTRIHHLLSVIDYCKRNSRDYEIIIVDDGSEDDTVDKAQSIISSCDNAKIVKYRPNRGKGYAIAQGMRNARGKCRLFMDIDLSTPLEHISDALAHAVHCDIVIGTRRHLDARVTRHQSWLRENMGSCFTSLSRFILSTNVTDFTCGFKLFSKDAAEIIFSQNKIERWAFDSEILYLANKLGYKIKEMPVEWKNDDDTRVKMSKIILPTFFDLVKIRFRKYHAKNESTTIAYRSPLTKRVDNSVTAIVVAVFLLTFRILIFLATQDIGIEHDSAWYLGVAKNFAQNGKYASFTNNAIDSKTISPSIHERITVQDEQGNVYFPAGVTAGPGYVIPQAILMKLFGFGFWQYRLWPILGYIGLASILLLLAYKLGGNISLLVLAGIFWTRPDMVINYAFEAYSEHIALFFALLSLVIASSAVKKNDVRNSLLLSGLIFGISVMTKNLSLLLMPGVMFIISPDKIFRITAWKICFRRLIPFVLGVIFPIAIFILYEYVYLTVNLGQGAFAGVMTDFVMHWKNGGGDISGANWQFVILKIMTLNQIGNAHAILFLIFIAILPYYVYKYWENIYEKKFVLSLYIMFLGNYFWFVSIATSGWTRHIWMGLILLILLLAIIFSHVSKKYIQESAWSLYCVILGIIIMSVVVHEHASYSFFLSKDRFVNMWAKSMIGVTPNKLQGFVFSPIFPYKDLEDITMFLRKNENNNKRLYFADSFLVTEVAMETMRHMYPLVRAINDKKGGLLIIGPYQKGEISLLNNKYEPSTQSNYCSKILFSNPSYSVCEIVDRSAK